MRDSPARRRELILGSLRREGTLRVTELAQTLGVSEVTMRRDVDYLERKGHLHREHGIVTLPFGTLKASNLENLVIGLVVPNATYYFGLIIDRIQSQVASLGGTLAVRISGYGQGQDHRQVQQLIAKGATGIIIAPIGMRGEDRNYGWVASLPVPVVLLEREAERNSQAFTVDSVYSDHRFGVRLAIDELLGIGRNRCMLAVRTDSPTALAIRNGWKQEIGVSPESEGLPIVMTRPEEQDPAGFEACFMAILKAVREDGVNGILIHNDSDAVVLVQRLEAEGVRIPEDLAVISYDNEIRDLTDVPLTSISPEKQAMGSAAVSMLLERLQDPSGPAKHLALLPRLIGRGSTRAGGAPSARQVSPTL